MKRILLSTLAVALLTPTATATANTYDVYSCWAGAGTFRNPNASSAAWTMDQANAGGHFTAHQDCGTNGTNGAMTVISISGYDANINERARIAFAAPAGSTVARVQLWRNAWSYGTGSGAGSRRNSAAVLADSLPVSGGQEADGTTDVLDGTRGTRNTSQHGIIAANLLSLNTSSSGSSTVEYRVACGWAAGCPTSSPSAPGPNFFASGVDVYGAKVSVEDVGSPTVTVGNSGLFAGGDTAGARPVVVDTATDPSGIKKLAVFADGSATPIGVLDYEQDVNRCSWWKPVPCQNVSDVEIPVDTRQLTDGEHSFVVKAFDAADNEKASTTHYVTVKNATPADPTPPTGGNGGGGGSSNTGGGSTNGGNTGTGLPNGVDAGGSAGGGAISSGPLLTVSFDANGKTRVAAKYGRIVTVRGHLTDGAGGPIADAQLGYSAVPTKAGARVQNLGSVRTDSSGTFTVAVATKLGSRQLRFAYSPQLGGAAAATAQVQLDVMAPVTFKVGPKHVRNKHAVVFSGRLTAGPMPRKGKLVNLQVVVDGRWHTFATVRSSKTGKFKYRYRFMRTFRRVRYRFRALSRYEAAYPFIAGHSRTVRVRVN
jgi:hypothetical protein